MDELNLLVVAPLPPQRQATNAVPVVVNTLLTALAPRHHLTLVTASEYEQGDNPTLNEWGARGVRVHAVTRTLPRSFARWRWRARLAARWLHGIPWRSVWYYDPRLQTILSERLARESFDLILAQDNAAGMYEFRTRAPKVLTEMEVRTPNGHTNGSAQSLLERSVQLREARAWQAYQRAVWSRFEQIQVLTPHDANSLRALAPQLAGRLIINPFGVEMPPYVFPEREDASEIVFVGGFTHAPNVDAAHWLVRDIFPRILARCPHAHLTLVGSYPPASLCALSRGNITVAADVPAVEPYLDHAAIIVAPLRQGGGQRLKVLQGMAHAKAVVATTLGAEGLDLFGEPPLCIAENAQAFADAVVNLLQCVDARRALGKRARAFAQTHYSPEAYAARLENSYVEAMRSQA